MNAHKETKKHVIDTLGTITGVLFELDLVRFVYAGLDDAWGGQGDWADDWMNDPENTLLRLLALAYDVYSEMDLSECGGELDSVSTLVVVGRHSVPAEQLRLMGGS